MNVIMYTTWSIGTPKKWQLGVGPEGFAKMKAVILVPNAFTYTIIIKGCFKNGALILYHWSIVRSAFWWNGLEASSTSFGDS